MIYQPVVAIIEVMQVFEFHFNPPKQAELDSGQAKSIFDTFCYEPKNIYERKLGNLYLAGELKNVLPQNLRFLDNLAEIIKREYYSQFRLNAEGALKETLKRANEYLEKIAKSGDVSWLGNLSFAILGLNSYKKNWWELNFTQIGNFKILLLRGNQITDIGKNLEIQGLEPYPLKIFINIVSGKLFPKDKIIILSSQIYEFFSAHNLLKEIAKTSDLNEKKLREILKIEEKELSKISGFLLLIIEEGLPLATLSLKSEKKPIIFRKDLEKFRWTEIFSPIVKILKKIFKIISQLLENFLNFFQIKGLIDKIISPFKNLILIPKKIKVAIKPRAIILPNKSRLFYLVKHKNAILILTFIFFLALGAFIFQKEKQSQLKEVEVILNKIEEKIATAEGYLVLRETNLEIFKKANLLLKEAWDEVLPITETESPLKDKAISLKNSIESHLFNLNKLEIISEPKVLFNFEGKEFTPQKIIYFKGNLYLFSPFSQNLFKVNKKGEGNLIQTDQRFNLAFALEDSILFFTKPDKITFLKEDKIGQSFDLKEPYSDFNFEKLSSYRGSLYFLDSKRGEIVKYSAPLEAGKDSPKIWLDPKTKKVTEARSLTLDGSIWILNKEGIIDKYSAGKYQKTLSLDFFPYPKNFSKIFTANTFPYLYILEPDQNRIIIIDKTGGIVKQFQSEKFDNLNDFAISTDGKTIWLLNGLIVYQIEL